MYYNRYRYYDSHIGSFISQDPIGLEGGLNVYEFAPNAFGWVDPWGLKFKLPKTYKSPSGIRGAFSDKRFSYRIDINRITAGEGGFHIHILRDGSEVEKVMGKGAQGTYSYTHKGKKLLPPSEPPKTVTSEIRRLVRNAKKFIGRGK